MELYRWLQPLALCIACEAPFIGVESDEPESAAGMPGAGISGLPRPSYHAGGNGIGLGNAGMSGERHVEAGSPTVYPNPVSGYPASSAGHGGQGGQPEIGNDWLCRFESDICQCYADPSAFEPGWLDRADCPNSNWCTLRQEKACVCWASQEQYEGALENTDTIMVTECPNQ